MSDADVLFTRREQLLGLLPAFTAFALLGEARAQAPARRGAVRTWIDSQDEIARALAGGTISGRQWALEVERLGRAVDVAELTAEVGRARLTRGGVGSPNDPQKRHVRFLGPDGTPRPPCSISSPTMSSRRTATGTWSPPIWSSPAPSASATSIASATKARR